MDVRRSATFEAALDGQLGLEGRPSREDFERVLSEAVELTFARFWDDPGYVGIAERSRDIRTVVTVPSGAHLFPPGVFYARRLDDDVIELLDVEFHWDFWELG